MIMEPNEANPEAELKKARITIKKLERELNLARTAIERNRTTSEAKDNLSKIIEEKKSELEMYMNLLLGNCPDIIMLFNKNGKLAYCTESFLKIAGIAGFGMIADWHYRHILQKYTNQSFLDMADEVYRKTITEGNSAPVMLHQTIDFSGQGNPRDYTIQMSPMKDENDNNRGAMILFYDITELLEARKEAENANRAKSDFLAMVSHEIRTPLNAVVGISAMLEQTELTEEQRNFLKKMRNSSGVLQGLINDILDFSKIEAGKLELVNEFFSPSHLLERLKEVFELLFSEKDLNFRCVFSEDLPKSVFGDEKRIGQILTNLLNNAYKYTRQGEVIFWADALPASETAGESGGIPDGVTLRFAVEDTGIGIKEEALPRLFSAFEQLDLVRNKQVQGTGLGLAITKRLCSLMNGVITVTSTYNVGSIFTVTIPFKTGGAEDLPADETTAAAFSAPESKVLLVDDIDINLEITSFMLNSFDIHPDTAQNGIESIEKVKNKQYDLILMDHMMPEMDGVEAVRIIRSLEGRNAETPIIALTANAVAGAREMFLNSGFNGLLAKPIDIKALTDTLLRWLPEKLVVI
jgi:signal transduction histidine kinase/ActR/RegA family two-component response regulator